MVISIYKTFKRRYTHLQELQQDMGIWLKGSHQNKAIMIKNKNWTLVIIAWKWK